MAERRWRVSAVDISEVAIGKLSQAAGQLNVTINLFAVDVAEYNFETAQFDLIILFYHLDRSLFPKILSALNPVVCLSARWLFKWNSEIALATAAPRPLVQTELVSLVPGLEVIYHSERPVRDRGIVEFVAKRSDVL